METYEELVFFKQRLIYIVEKLRKDEVNFLLFKVGKNDELEINLDDT